MKQKDILIIIVLLFIFTLIALGSSIYTNTVTSTISESVDQDIKPIDKTFDTKAIDNLKSREKIIPSYDLENPIPTLLSPSKNASQEGKIIQ